MCLRVLFASGYNPFQAGSGPGNGLYYLSQALAEIGCNVHILTLKSEQTLPLDDRVSIHYYDNPLGKSKLGNSWIPFSLFSVRQIKDLCRKYDIDIVNGNSPTTFMYSFMRDDKQPFVVTAHGTSFGELRSLYSIPNRFASKSVVTEGAIIQPIWGYLSNVEYNFADKVVAVSKAVEQEIINYFHVDPQNVVTIHNGVDVLPLKEEEEENLILSVGRMTWRKGFLYLIDAMPTVLREFPKAKLMLVGEGLFKQKLIDYVKRLNLEKSVIFSGYLQKEELFKLYLKSQVYVQPSLYEPLGNTILEAMAYQKPVIATRVGGIPELIIDKNNGILVNPCDASGLAEAIKMLFSDVSYAKQIAKNAKATINASFTWESIAKQTFNFYEECLS
jgi:glycosyltransferase involved in cell wall biosynthesis